MAGSWLLVRGNGHGNGTVFAPLFEPWLHQDAWRGSQCLDLLLGSVLAPALVVTAIVRWSALPKMPRWEAVDLIMFLVGIAVLFLVCFPIDTRLREYSLPLPRGVVRGVVIVFAELPLTVAAAVALGSTVVWSWSRLRARSGASTAKRT